jgi:DNA modification methylase
MTVRVIEGDCRDVLPTMEAESMHCVVTSPPYFGLRDYGVAGQIGLEPTPDEFIAELVAVFREVRRVLRKDGTVWLNLGDSYAAGGHGGGGTFMKMRGGDGNPATGAWAHRKDKKGWRSPPTGYKPKDLLMIPARVALALQADGWWLRSEIIWAKPNPMPESVTDRPTSAHEKIYLLTKSQRYFYDADAVREAESVPDWDNGTRVFGGANKHGANAQHGSRTTGRLATVRPQRARAIEIAREKGLTEAHLAAIRAAGVSDTGKAQVTQSGFGKNTPEIIRLASEAKAALGGYYREFLTLPEGRNLRNVWTIATAPFSEAHFATFPPALAERCIKAGCPSDGTVLDPFGGAGTTGLVADRLKRNAVLIELNPTYAAMARKRIAGDCPMFTEVA